jgi:hypothetical protein
MALRPAGLCCDRKGLRAVALAVAQCMLFEAVGTPPGRQ